VQNSAAPNRMTGIH